MITPEQQLQDIARKIQELQQVNFWGELVIQFREGNCVYVRENKTTPMDVLSRQMRA